MGVEVLPDWLHQRAALTPNRLALIASGERWSFRELDERVAHVAHALRAQGLEENDRVALLLKNGAPLVVLLHALSRLGAVSVPLNTRLTPAELQWQLTDSRARLLIHDETHSPQATHLSGPPTQLDTSLTQSQPKSLISSLSSHFPLTAPHSLLYTSGTTGHPKGALLTFGNHWWSAIGSALNLGLHENDRWLACLPLFHVGGLAILLRSVIYGITAEVHEAFDPLAVNRAIDEGATIVSVVSVMLRRMLETRGDVPYPPTLRCVLLGGGPAPRDLLEMCAQRNVPVVQTYGLTEAASQVATLAPEDALRKLGSAGKPLFPTELRIERAEGADAVGEIVIRGPTLTPGYANQPEATAQVWRDGWFHTGDLGYLDEEGYLYVLDRRADLIISGGENVYPAEVEAVLLAHPAVEEAGVVGAPDEHWGQVPIAFIKTRSPITPAELKQFCAERLARYKIPARVELVENALPRNAAGKLLRRTLLEWVNPRGAGEQSR